MADERSLVLNALNKSLYKYPDVSANTGIALNKTKELIGELILEAIDVRKCTLMQIKKHFGISRSFDLSPIIEMLIAAKLIVKKTNKPETITAFFRTEKVLQDFHLGDECIEGDWENAGEDDSYARYLQSERLDKEAGQKVGIIPAEPTLASPPKRQRAEADRPVVSSSPEKQLTPERIRGMAKSGLSQVKIAESLKMGFSTLQRKLRDDAELMSAYKNGRTAFLNETTDRTVPGPKPDSPKNKMVPSPTRDKFLSNLANIQTWSQQGKTKKEAAELLGVTSANFTSYFYSIPEIKEHWEKGKLLRKTGQSESLKTELLEVAEELGLETDKPKVQEAIEMIEKSGLTTEAKSLVTEILTEKEDENPIGESEKFRDKKFDYGSLEDVIKADYSKIPVTEAEDEAFDELTRKLEANDIAHELEMDKEVSGDFVGSSRLTSQENRSAYIQKHQGCSFCGKAFNMFPDHISADGTAYCSRDCQNAGNALTEHNSITMPKGLEYIVNPNDKLVISDGKSKATFSPPKVSDEIDEVQTDPRFSHAVERLSVNGRSKEGFERKKEEFLNNLPKIPTMSELRNGSILDQLREAAEKRPANFKILNFEGGIEVQLSVDGNLFNAPAEVRDAIEFLITWSQKPLSNKE